MVDLNDYDTWEKIAGAMGDVAHEYDLADTSERVDVVQLVCEAAARLGYHLVEDTPERLRRQIEFLEILADGGRLEVNGIPWRKAFEKINAIVSDPV